MRSAQVMIVIVILGLGAACSNYPSPTGVNLQIKFLSEQLGINRIHLEGFSSDGKAFPAVDLEVDEQDITSGEETIVILFGDELDGHKIMLWVWGMKVDEKVAFGSVEVTIRRDYLLKKVVLMGENPICGDGIFDSKGEFCDIGIESGEGSCPTSCESNKDCQLQTLVDQGTCFARCVTTQIVNPLNDDGCCPPTGTFENDNDCKGICGNGLLEPNERCDILIDSEQHGACPIHCNDANACTKDELHNGGTCQAFCQFVQITQNYGGDGCCLPGANATVDNDCVAVCGNGYHEPGERCDFGIQEGEVGSCPTQCDDADPCTRDSLLDEGTCQAKCLHTLISQFVPGDGCCPVGGNQILDSDCPVVCGNGVVEQGELCDQAIEFGHPGACPIDCDDQIACTEDTLLAPSGCRARCENSLITQCGVSDGCCPASCSPEQDIDCEFSCGDGFVDQSVETCDIAIDTPAVGSCPTSCVDDDPCTEDRLVGAGTCQAYCSYLQKPCIRDDGCCAPGCDNNTDNDCPAVCGNAVVEPGGGELCDLQIDPGQPGACPSIADCDDQEPCTLDSLSSPDSCQAQCDSISISEFVDGDGCCIGDTLFHEDSDCPGCGNEQTEAELGEECDDANQDLMDGCTTSCTRQDGSIGDPCSVDEDCQEGFRCAPGQVGGYCFSTPCKLQDPVNSCPSNSVCMRVANKNLCVELCQDRSDCRWKEGYVCHQRDSYGVCIHGSSIP